MRYLKAGFPYFSIFAFLIMLSICRAQQPETLATSFYKIDKFARPEVQRCNITSLIIKRGSAEFQLGPGEITLFDFGTANPIAIYYKGKGIFNYNPPNKIETDQLKKFTGDDKLSEKIQWATFFLSGKIDGLPESSAFKNMPVDQKTWETMYDSWFDAFNHLDIYLPDRILADLMSPNPGGYFYADMRGMNHEQLVFIEDRFSADRYRLYNLIYRKGYQSYDMWAGFTSGEIGESSPMFSPIDITHYDIEGSIREDGAVAAQCRISFKYLEDGYRYLNFYCARQDSIYGARDSRGNPLKIISRDVGFRLLDTHVRQDGFAVILGDTSVAGDSDFIDIGFGFNFAGSCGNNASSNRSSNWYPSNTKTDFATYEMIFDSPVSCSLITGCPQLYSETSEGRKKMRFVQFTPINLVTLDYGIFTRLDAVFDSIPVMKAMFRDKVNSISYDQMLADIGNSLVLYNRIFGSYPYDTLTIIEDMGQQGHNSPAAIWLPRRMYFNEDEKAGWYENYRTSLVASQWLGCQIASNSYRDSWILAGLAQYCGYWFYELSSQDQKTCEMMLNEIRKYTLYGSGAGSQGVKAGPMVLGTRLNCSKSNDYNPNVVYKSAYLYHMIRYMMRDYRTGSDDAFIAFLKDIVQTYRNNTISTADFKQMMEKHLYPGLDWFFNQWVYGTDVPEYTFSYTCNQKADSNYQVICHIEQSQVPVDFKMMIPIAAYFENDQKIVFPVMVDKPVKDIPLPLLPKKPNRVVFNDYAAVLCRSGQQ